MAEPVPPPQQYDPKAVYVNGQAIGLITALVGQLREDLSESEKRLRGDFKDQMTHHEEMHRATQLTMTRIQDNYDTRIKELEIHDKQAIEEERVAKAKREGQLMVITWTVGYVERNKHWLVPAMAALIGGTVFGRFFEDLSRNVLRALGIAP